MNPLRPRGAKIGRPKRNGVPAEVIIDARGVIVGVLRVEWRQMERISLVVRHRRGVPLPAPGWAFVIESASGTMTVPSGQTEAFLSHAHHLAGFDHAAVMAALSRGQSTIVTVYRAGSSRE